MTAGYDNLSDEAADLLAVGEVTGELAAIMAAGLADALAAVKHARDGGATPPAFRPAIVRAARKRAAELAERLGPKVAQIGETVRKLERRMLTDPDAAAHPLFAATADDLLRAYTDLAYQIAEVEVIGKGEDRPRHQIDPGAGEGGGKQAA